MKSRRPGRRHDTSWRRGGSSHYEHRAFAEQRRVDVHRPRYCQKRIGNLIAVRAR
jgi:hypothetical protein